MHSFYSIGDASLILHTEAFKAAAATQTAHQATLDIATALAMVGVHLLSDAKLAGAVKAEFEESSASCFRK